MNKLNNTENFNTLEGYVKKNNIFYKDCCDKFIDYVKKSHNKQDLERVADTSKTIDHIADVNKKVSLTEQWKKGELEQGWYYVLLFSNEEYITFIDGNWVVDDRLIGADIKEVLAEVPDYIEWKNYVTGFCDEHGYNLKLSEENQKLKELLKECRETIFIFTDEEPCRYDHHGFCQTHNWYATEECVNERCKYILTRIYEVLK